jgi:hypothetical protein
VKYHSVALIEASAADQFGALQIVVRGPCCRRYDEQWTFNWDTLPGKILAHTLPQPKLDGDDRGLFRMSTATAN